MRRREFITLHGCTAATWPLAARAQQAPMPVIGFLMPTSVAWWSHLVAAFHQGLGQTGYVEGQNLAIEYRWAEGNSIGCRRSPPTWSVASRALGSQGREARSSWRDPGSICDRDRFAELQIG